MGNVTLSIGGRSTTLACPDGDEQHLLRLASIIDEKAEAAGAFSQTEPRMLLFAALMLADELDGLRAGAAPIPRLPMQAALPADFADRLQRIAAYVENLADRLDAST